jgi:undecaprenyl diphosphate synthase
LLLKTIEEAESKTVLNSRKTLALFLDYGERFMLEEFAKARMMEPTLETYELLSKINNGLPLFDMVLRTSGEQRMSGFGPLATLAEFVSIKKNLPEIEDEDIINALKEFSSRQRRFGGR